MAGKQAFEANYEAAYADQQKGATAERVLSAFQSIFDTPGNFLNTSGTEMGELAFNIHL